MNWIRQRAHWQNLNEDRLGHVNGSILRHGRIWIHRKERYRPQLHAEWMFWACRFALQLEVGSGDSNDGLACYIALPGFLIHLSLDGILPQWFIERGRARAKRTPWMGYEYMAWPRTTGIRIFSGGIWFDIWNQSMGWDSRQPKWMAFNFHPIDFVFGSAKYTYEDISEHETAVPMPEANYPATVKIQRQTWKRTRWPWWPSKIMRLTSHIEVPDTGVPVPGKGENAWDCGEDAIFSTGCSEPSVSAAVAKMVQAALETRARYGGENWTPKAPVSR